MSLWYLMSDAGSENLHGRVMPDTALVNKTITLESREEAVILSGMRDSYLPMIRDAFHVKLVARGLTITLEGPELAVKEAERAIEQLRVITRKQGRLLVDDVKSVIEVIHDGDARGVPTPITKTDSGKQLRPRTDGQGRYVQALKTHDIVICVGPAGTGKTYLAVAQAVSLLRAGIVRKLVLVRPAVEAGEKLGFLPGDLVAKINPYLRPLFDSLNEIMGAKVIKEYMESDIIEILPLAYMRGRTLNEACIILDEGQNATVSQMKMFLTRMGFGSKVIVTGDMTQTDLPRTTRSGLNDAVQRLRNIDGISIVHLADGDIVRNPLVQKIVLAYDEEDQRARKPRDS